MQFNFMVKLAAIILALSITFNTSDLAACLCLPPEATAAELSDVDAIFSGTIIDLSTDWDGGVIAVFDVDRIWKGTHDRTLTVSTGSDASCGVGFVEGDTWLVYANAYGESDLSTSSCTRTKLMRPGSGNSRGLYLAEGGALRQRAEEDLQALGPGTIMPPAPLLLKLARSRAAWFALALVAGAISLLALQRSGRPEGESG